MFNFNTYSEANELNNLIDNHLIIKMRMRKKSIYNKKKTFLLFV